MVGSIAESPRVLVQKQRRWFLETQPHLPACSLRFHSVPLVSHVPARHWHYYRYRGVVTVSSQLLVPNHWHWVFDPQWHCHYHLEEEEEEENRCHWHSRASDVHVGAERSVSVHETN